MPDNEDFSELPPPSAEELSALPPPQMTIGPDGTPQYFVPSSDAGKPERPVLEIDPVLKRDRLTSFFRLVLVIPQGVCVLFLSIAALIVAFLSWWAALFTARVPSGFADYLERYQAYSTRVSAYAYLLTDKYPPFRFEAHDYPVRVRFVRHRLNRWAVFFRLAMTFPASFIGSLLQAVLILSLPITWLLAVILGRTPESFYKANAIVARYKFRSSAYLNMISTRYPVGPYGDTYIPQHAAMASNAPMTTPEGLPAYPVADVTVPRLPLTSGTVFDRTRGALVVLILGSVLGFGINTATQIAQFNLKDPVVSGYNNLGTAEVAFDSAVNSCSHSNDATSCLTPAAEKYAKKVDNYETNIKASSFGSGIDDLTNILDQLVAELRHIPNTATRTEVRESIDNVHSLERQLQSAVLNYQSPGN